MDANAYFKLAYPLSAVGGIHIPHVEVLRSDM